MTGAGRAGTESEAPGRPDPEELRAIEAAAAARIHALAVPTPFLVGPVNCYLIEDEPLTLVDTGPRTGESLDALERSLRELGHRVEDLGLIVITHQHMDHLGLLETLVGRSGAEVAALDLLVGYLADFDAGARADDEFSVAVMRRHGVAPEVVDALGSVGAAFRSFGSGGRVTVPLRDGGALTLRDRTLTALHRPGHSPSDTLLWDERRRILIAGDHLLARISSNPLLSRPLPAPGEGPSRPGAEPGEGRYRAGGALFADRPHALLSYVESLGRTRELPAELVLGGHGPPVVDHVRLIDERLRLHDRRAARLLAMLADGPQTAYDLARRMWGNVAVTQAYLTLSEVIGHLDMLIADGRVRELDGERVTRFEAA